MEDALVFLGIGALFVSLVLLQSWPLLVAYIGAVLSFVAHAHGEGVHWPVFAWFSYSFAYWAVRQDEDDHVLLLTLTSLVQGGALLLTQTDIPRKNPQATIGAAAVFLMLPFNCNNLHYSPLSSIVRLLAYFAIVTFDRERHWLAQQYALFATQEVATLLALCHLALIYVDKNTREATVAPVLPQTQDAENIAEALRGM